MLSQQDRDSKSLDSKYVFTLKQVQDSQIEGIRAALEIKLMIKESDFKLLEPFSKPWYTSSEKSCKNKLGKLYSCQFKNESKKYVCRVMDMKRVTSYQMESCFTFLSQIYVLQLSKYVMFPTAIYINSENSIHIISAERPSLY